MNDYEDSDFEAFEEEEFDDFDIDTEDSLGEDEFLPALGALLPIAAKVAPSILSALGALFEEESDNLDDFLDEEDEWSSDTEDEGFDGEDYFEDLEEDAEEIFLTEQIKKAKSSTISQANAGALLFEG